MMQMQRQIDELNNKIMLKDAQLNKADALAKDFQSLGPLKALIQRLEEQLATQTEELVGIKIENEDLKSQLYDQQVTADQLTFDLKRSEEILTTVNQMYLSVQGQLGNLES